MKFDDRSCVACCFSLRRAVLCVVLLCYAVLCALCCVVCSARVLMLYVCYVGALIYDMLMLCIRYVKLHEERCFAKTTMLCFFVASVCGFTYVMLCYAMCGTFLSFSSFIYEFLAGFEERREFGYVLIDFVIH